MIDQSIWKQNRFLIIFAVLLFGLSISGAIFQFLYYPPQKNDNSFSRILLDSTDKK